MTGDKFVVLVDQDGRPETKLADARGNLTDLPF
jgi:hypothetical protein